VLVEGVVVQVVSFGEGVFACEVPGVELDIMFIVFLRKKGVFVRGE
jgi:hypothetical protein